jgi:cobalt-zinc-cadmium resistance protein CzcA
LYDGTKHYDIVIRYLPQYRNNIDEIKKILVPAANGSLIPMSQLADISFTEGQTNIYRYNNKRMITVRTDIRNRDQGGFVRELKKRVEKEINIPKGYDLVYGGQFENLERAGKQLAITIPLTLIVVFVFLFMLFRNFKHTMAAASCILFALAGGITALIIRGYYFNVSAGVGFISIFGVSVMAGVLIISALKRATESGLISQSLIQSTSKDQVIAVVTILVLAILGLIPAALSTGIGSDVQRPLATVIIGGLTSTLIFAPLIIPPLFWWTNKTDPSHSENQTG